MYQVEQHYILPDHEWWDYCDAACYASKNLYNTAQYSQRQSFIYKHGVLSQASMDKLFKDSEHYQALPSKVAQLVLKQNSDAWFSYFKALAAWKEDPSKFTGKPKPPDYIEPGEKGRNFLKFNNQAVGKREFKKGFVIPSMSPIKIPVKPGLKWEQLVEVRIVPKTRSYVVEVVYEIPEPSEFFCSLNPTLAASIDIGIDVLAMITFNDPTIQPIAINGKPLKAENQWMNKQVAKLKSILGFGTSQRIQNITRNRNNFVHNYLHQATRRITQELLSLGVTHVAIGKNEQWKTSVNMGRKNNQSFVQIPHAKFITMLQQKLEAVGIIVQVGEESYTSRASFLDWDEIPIYNPNSNESHQFSGKRIQTKKYKTRDGLVIHADVNGSFNTGRKVLPNFFDGLKSIIERDRGCVVAHPRRINLKITLVRELSKILPLQMTETKDMNGSVYV